MIQDSGVDELLQPGEEGKKAPGRGAREQQTHKCGQAKGHGISRTQEMGTRDENRTLRGTARVHWGHTAQGQGHLLASSHNSPGESRSHKRGFRSQATQGQRAEGAEEGPVQTLISQQSL